MASGKKLAGARVGDTKLRGVQWMDNDHLLVMVSSTSLPPPGFLGSREDYLNLVSFDVPKKP